MARRFTVPVAFCTELSRNSTLPGRVTFSAFAGGLLAGYFGGNATPKLLENAWERSDLQVHFNWMVFVFTAGVTILTGILFGLAPAFAAARGELAHGLKETAQTTTRRRKGFGSKALVGLQIALSTLLVIGAGLFLRTLAERSECGIPD